MRLAILAATMIAAAAPAAAQTFPEEMDEEIARSIPHPSEIDAVAVTMDRVLGAMMNVPVGDLANAVDPYRREHPGTTIGDLGRRDDPWFEERMRGSVYDVTDGLGDMATQVAIIAPILRRSLADLERNLDAAIGDYDRAYED